MFDAPTFLIFHLRWSWILNLNMSKWNVKNFQKLKMPRICGSVMHLTNFCFFNSISVSCFQFMVANVELKMRCWFW